jgi:hypothetical protein
VILLGVMIMTPKRITTQKAGCKKPTPLITFPGPYRPILFDARHGASLQ